MTKLNLVSGKLEMEIPKQGSVLQYLEFRRKVMPDPEPELPPAAILEGNVQVDLVPVTRESQGRGKSG